MINPTIAAYIFTLFTAVVVIFQFALALGAPWGEMAMGGRFPGRYPPKLRVAALVQMFLLIFAAMVVLTRAGLILIEFYDFSRFTIWFVVALFVVSSFLNIITPSKKERILWAPVAIILVVCSLIVANS